MERRHVGAADLRWRDTTVERGQREVGRSDSSLRDGAERGGARCGSGWLRALGLQFVVVQRVEARCRLGRWLGREGEGPS